MVGWYYWLVIRARMVGWILITGYTILSPNSMYIILLQYFAKTYSNFLTFFTFSRKTTEISNFLYIFTTNYRNLEFSLHFRDKLQESRIFFTFSRKLEESRIFFTFSRKLQESRIFLTFSRKQLQLFDNWFYLGPVWLLKVWTDVNEHFMNRKLFLQNAIVNFFRG